MSVNNEIHNNININNNNNNKEITAMQMTPKTQQQQGEPTMKEMNDLFPIQPENEVVCFELTNGSIVEFTISNKPIETMTPFEIVDEMQKLTEIDNFIRDCQQNKTIHNLSTNKNYENNEKLYSRIRLLYNAEVIHRWDKSGFYVCSIDVKHTRTGVWHFATEARLMPNSNESGWFIEYNRIANYTPNIIQNPAYEHRLSGKKIVKNVPIKTHRQKYKQIVIVSETKNGVRLLVKNTKTKAVYWGQTISTVKGNNNLFAVGLSAVNYFIMGELQEMYAEKDVIRLTESYPKFVPAQISESSQLHEFTQRDLYYFSGAKNLKDVFNKAYGKTANNGLTKNAFGGAQVLKHFEELQAAVVIIRMFKAFPREFFDNIKLNWVINNKPSNVKHISSEDISLEDCYESEDWDEEQAYTIPSPNSILKDKVHPVVTLDSNIINGYAVFFSYFGINSKMIQEVQDTINSGYMPSHRTVIDAVDALKTIPVGSNRKAIINQIRRQKLTFEEIHDYVVNEARKYKTEIRKTPNTPVINSFHKQEIIPGVVFVAPQTTEDLQTWGNEQNNCIGTNYSNRVADRQTFIFGFMDKQTQEWIGHARISYHNGQMTIDEFRAKYNEIIKPNIANPIIKWIKENLSTKTKQKEKTNA